MQDLRSCSATSQNHKHFRIHKCINDNCSYYKQNLKKLPKDLPRSEYWKYKLRYLYRKFSVNLFDMDFYQLPKWATSFNYKKNYAKTAAVIIRSFVDSYDYKPSNELAVAEIYAKIKGVKSYVWLIMDKVSQSILGYQVFTFSDVGPCILTMRIAFDTFKKFPVKALKFIADGYAQQFKIEKDCEVFITQVIGLTNHDEVSKKSRPFKQFIEGLNPTFKESYRTTCGYGTEDGSVHNVSLWIAYYNFLRPHEISSHQNQRFWFCP